MDSSWGHLVRHPEGPPALRRCGGDRKLSPLTWLWVDEAKATMPRKSGNKFVGGGRKYDFEDGESYEFEETQEEKPLADDRGTL